MANNVAERIMSLMDSMTRASLDELPPAHRRRFADLLKHWAKIAETPKNGATPPKAGVLAALHDGVPRHE